MAENLKNISSKELLEMYEKTKEFLTFLDKEHKNLERTKEEK